MSSEDEAFEKSHRKLITRKKEAAEDEDYDLAHKIKEELQELKANEKVRLNAAKTMAIDDEEYKEAKRIKSRIARVEEL